VNDFSGDAFPSGTVSFAATETSKLITVNVIGDTAIELDDGFTMTLRNPAAGTAITAATASGVIQNDDDANTAPSFALPVGPASDTWTARENSRAWLSIALSADGTKMAAVPRFGQIYTSSDAGETWKAREANREWRSIASSADGIKMAAVVENGQIYTSTDSGATWTPRESVRKWNSIASSADGMKLAAVARSGQIYTSTDSGATWTPRESVRNWTTIASSADGMKLAALDLNSIFTSGDSGVTWGERTTGLPADVNWQSIASSASGTKLAAVVLGGQIYTTTDSGATWAARENSREWRSIASSADGTKLAAVQFYFEFDDDFNEVNIGQIFTSVDSGMTWVERTTGLPVDAKWQSIASTADGTKLAAVIQDGPIYTFGIGNDPLNLRVVAGAGSQTAARFATGFSPGPAGESAQTLVGYTVTVESGKSGLFSTAPAIANDGTLTYTPAVGPGGNVTITVVAQASGGTANGGVDTSAPQTFTITISGTPKGESVASDGLISGGTVFFDGNFNGSIDANEPQTTTDSAGKFSIAPTIPTFDTDGNGQIDSNEGRLVIQGGTDIATGLPNTTQMTAPPDATVINPLTTLVTGVLASNPGLSSDQAQSSVKSSLGITANVDLRSFDMFAEASVSNPDASQVLNAAAKVQDTVLQVSSVVSGKTGNSQQNAVDSAIAAMVNKISAGQSVDLTDSTELKNILSDASGNTLTSAELDVSTEIIKASNDKKEAAFNQGKAPLELAADLVKVQLISQGEASADLMKVAQGTLDQDEALNRHTGSALDVSVNAAPVGDLTGGEARNGAFSFKLVWRDISHWTVIEKINANRDCTLGLLMVSPAQRVGAYV